MLIFGGIDHSAIGQMTCACSCLLRFWVLIPLPRSLSEAHQLERAGRTYLLAYRKLNAMSSSMGILAWVLTPKWHASWYFVVLGGFNLIFVCLSQWLKLGTLSDMLDCFKAFAHCLQEAKQLQLNPRFNHTFCDEDMMSQLKKWARQSNGRRRRREMVVSRLSRMRLKTLRWKLPELSNRVK